MLFYINFSTWHHKLVFLNFAFDIFKIGFILENYLKSLLHFEDDIEFLKSFLDRHAGSAESLQKEVRC